jgi:hypothetical protein
MNYGGQIDDKIWNLLLDLDGKIGETKLSRIHYNSLWYLDKINIARLVDRNGGLLFPSIRDTLVGG